MAKKVKVQKINNEKIFNELPLLHLAKEKIENRTSFERNFIHKHSTIRFTQKVVF